MHFLLTKLALTLLSSWYGQPAPSIPPPADPAEPCAVTVTIAVLDSALFSA